MAKITEPGSLNQGIEVVFNTGSFEIELYEAGNLSTDGVTLQALYSFTKDEWRTDSGLIKFPFPFVAITGEQFELINGWDFVDTGSKNLIRDAGWALRDTNGVTQEEYMNITSLGLFNDSLIDRAYYLQVDGGTPVDIVLTGEVNQAIQIYSHPDLDNFDYRGFFKIYLREQGKTFGYYDLNAEQNITSLTYRKYALPLVNALDLKITHDDNTIETTAPYTGMSITYLDTPQTETIGSDTVDFSIIIDGNNGTAEEIYEFVQWSLRQPDDIDSGSGVVRGDTADALLLFIGDTLRTLRTSAGEGVFIENFQAADTNRLEFTGDDNSIYTYPFVAAGNMIFNDNLYNDTLSKYFVFFTNDDAGDNTGRDFGTANAILIQDNDDIEITGLVGGNPTIAFTYDYDGNIQRGAASAATVAPFTAVAIGAATAQYVVTVGNISRTTANVINFVAALERNYVA